MSHHFDTPAAKDDPRFNVRDFYRLADGAEIIIAKDPACPKVQGQPAS